MTTVIAYKATSNESVQKYMADREERHTEWWSRVQAFSKQIGHDSMSMRRGVFGEHILGYVPTEGEAPDSGWRLHKDWGICVPNLRSKAGKALDIQLKSLSWRSPEVIGIKEMIHAPSDVGGFSTYVLSPSVEQGRTGDWFLAFGRKPFEDELGKIDPAVWHPVKLSEYFAETEDLESAA
ncbi:hypothetical protein [Pseudarthrobacter sp. PS3-L1]|uniref:hypothetical protein n=1 Tax=Pseudarthrobacter sp. PS3-L1 TaxID=3046207 RepID=UPI0024BB908E|nr:hypothetical protein [Pseudarthrobacter sp. PS3-L1]MDJ0319780.1 hypothetical protein [Pseudarthrobacter sp. PS3-L1]